MRNNMSEFMHVLLRRFPECHAKLTVLQSGMVLLDFMVGDEPYVMEYLPTPNIIGVSKVKSATYGWEGVDRAFDSFEKASEYVLVLLSRLE